ncbi:sugar kinase [Diaminobutyricibacter tongyongensis]|uniref:Sugar kinase n=2 Tax=Leifsonia tongyongensis TaxID=1268043 RepID=A0A6L9XSL1_9MICO|nr:sugar kinase [Diaminobutyricibacter tongyongensis]
MFSRLISVGNVVVDILAAIPALPGPGGDVVATSSGLAAGGSFNVLAAAQRQGLASAYGGAHGSGPFGELVRASLAREGIDVLLPPVDAVDTGWDVALTAADGERTFITAVGAEALLAPAMLDAIDVAASDAVHVSGYGLLREPNRSAITGWLAALPPACVVLFDPGPLGDRIEPDALAAVRARADWWSGNEAEALAAAGLSRAHESADPADAARMLAAAAPSRRGGAVVRLGESGCLLAVGDGSVERIGGFEVTAVDTNGAGDAHIGAFLAALAQGSAPASAARRANASAALAVSRRGPATSPTASDVDAFLSAHPLN